jgi:hypothetical protein
MKILVACECSGKVRDAFIRRGHDAWSCDIQPSDTPTNRHLQQDVSALLTADWDMLIAFPPCTDLAVSGARHFQRKIMDGTQWRSIQFFMQFANAPINKIAIENPIGIMSRQYRKPDQIIQPWQFGHGETKATCLWLKNLPILQPTNIVDGRENRIWRMPPSADRAKQRSETYQGIAEAMASQWG